MNAADIRVSVIVGTYRRDESLEKALASLTAQTHKNLEILVADDNALPEWNAKVEKLARAANAKHLVNEKNLGSAENRNRAARAATGEYIAFLDDDDTLFPDKIASQLAVMRENRADFCIEDLLLVDENGKYVETRARAYLKDFSRDALFRAHLKYHLSGTDSMMFTREYFFKIGGFPPINLGDEFYLMARAIDGGGKLCYRGCVGARAVVHAGGRGLSAGESKLTCERDLYAYKKTQKHRLSRADWRYVRMRHHAVNAFAYLRMRAWPGFAKSAFLCFCASPVACARLFFEKTRGRGEDA